MDTYNNIVTLLRLCEFFVCVVVEIRFTNIYIHLFSFCLFSLCYRETKDRSIIWTMVELLVIG